jgi:4-hydroxy-2-oxoheptanedioate aldolase
MPAPQSLPVNAFKRDLAAGKPQVGLWLGLDSPNATEIVAGSGFDWLLLDLEHSTISVSSVVDHLRAASGGTAELMVRIPWNDPVILKRLLDAGVRSFMIPFVQSAEEAARAVAATRYPPQGIRGVAGNTRASNYNRIADYARRCHEELCVVVQIEHPTGLAAVEAIAAVDGVDGLFIGPNDLASTMGYLANPSAPEMKVVIEEGLARIRRTGKAAGILQFSRPEARALLAAGVNFVAVGSDASILARQSEALLADVAPAA